MSRADQLLIAAVAVPLAVAAVAGWLLLTAATPSDPGGEGVVAFSTGGPISTSTASAAATPGAELVVDVEGAVLHPGIVRLPPDARIADAIRAAGGYAADVDAALAAQTLNLAATLADGAQVYVPRLGEAATPGGAGTDGGTDGGLVDLNHATPEELDALPGIGPVTVQKIVAARTERPFATLEELVERKVMNSGQLEKIRDLVTLG